MWSLPLQSAKTSGDHNSTRAASTGWAGERHNHSSRVSRAPGPTLSSQPNSGGHTVLGSPPQGHRATALTLPLLQGRFQQQLWAVFLGIN